MNNYNLSHLQMKKNNIALLLECRVERISASVNSPLC